MKKIIISIYIFLFGLCLFGCEKSNGNIKNEDFVGNLICQDVAISSWVTNLDVSIKDNNLYIEDELQGELNEENIFTSLWNFNKLSIVSGFKNVITEFKDIDKGYVASFNGESDVDMRVYIVEKDNKKYMFFVVLTDALEYEIMKGYYLNDYATLKFSDYHGGCIVMSHQEEVKIGTNYNLSQVKEILSSSAFIDLETLTVYTDFIKATTNLDLITYNDGVYDHYIIQYLFKNEDFNFTNRSYTLEQLKNYEYQIINDEIIISIDNVTYTFEKSMQFTECYYLKEIKSNRNLFNDYNEAKSVLDILYGSSDYQSNYISVELSNNSFIISLIERPLVG